MPRGDNPNSRRNLLRGGSPQPITSENAAEMQKRAMQAQRWKKTVREAIHEQTTPEEVAELIMKMARKNNLKALDMLLDVTGEKAAAKIEIQRPIQESTEEMDGYFRELEKTDGEADL